jgi:general stress protein YciG
MNENESEKRKRGIGHLSPERRREIASMGGRKISENREFMKAIGQKGGKRTSRSKRHMAAIGRMGGIKGAEKRWGKKPPEGEV